VVIVGGGYISHCHVDAYLHMDSELVTVSAVVDVNEQAGRAVADKVNCAWYETLEQAVAAVPADVIDICVPTFLHERFVLQAARMGKHVLCEKPAALSLAQFDGMASVCRENHVKFMTAQVLRYMPAYREIAKRVRNDQIGAVHMLSSKRLCQHPLWTSWHKDPLKSGGGLYDLNAHEIDFIYSLFGLPQKITTVGWKNATGCWNHVAQLLSWPDKQALCEVSLEMTQTYPFTEEFRITTDQGTLDYRSSAGENIRDGQSVSTLRYYTADTEPETVHVAEGDPFQCLLESFLRAVEEGTELPISTNQTRDVMRILDASKVSLETGKTVCLEDIHV